MSTYFLFCSELAFPSLLGDEGRGTRNCSTEDGRRRTRNGYNHQAGAFERNERAQSAITTRQKVKINKGSNSQKQNHTHHSTNRVKKHKNTPKRKRTCKNKKKTTRMQRDPRGPEQTVSTKNRKLLAKMKDQDLREDLKRVL